MVGPLERLSLVIDRVLTTHAERHPERSVAELEAAQIEALLWEARPQLVDGVDTARLARFVTAALEGALLMPRVKRHIAAMEGVAADIKRFVAHHARDPANVL